MDFGAKINRHTIRNTALKLSHHIRSLFKPFFLREKTQFITFSRGGAPGAFICEGWSLPLATNVALILAATAAAASRAPVGAPLACPIPPEPEDWSHLLGRLRRQKTWRVTKLEKEREPKFSFKLKFLPL